MESLMVWMKAGSPQHWIYLAGIAYMLVEWWMPRTAKTKANSVLEVVANLLSTIPGVRLVVGRLSTAKKS